MENTFDQKGIFSSKTISIIKNGVEVRYKSLFKYKEFTLDFELFTAKRSIQKEINYGILIFVAVFGIISVITLIKALADPDRGFGGSIFFLILTLAFLLVALSTKKRVIILHTSYTPNDLEIAFKNSNEVEAREFADQITEHTKKYLIGKYARVDRDLPRDGQIENLVALRHREIIDEEEFIRLKNILLDKESERRIGFN